MGSEIVARNVLDVFPVIPVGRQFKGRAAEFPDTRLDRKCQHADLVTGVVVVELAQHLVALPLKQGGNAVAKCGLAAVADMQRAGGVGGDEFHHDFLAAALSPAAEGLLLRKNA